MRISDWSSDVCSSDLDRARRIRLWRQIAPDLSQMADRRDAALAPVVAAQGKDPAAALLAWHAQGTRMARGARTARRRRVTLDTVQYLLGELSGGIAGFPLGLDGGGGSILAVPLMQSEERRVGQQGASTCLASGSDR